MYAKDCIYVRTHVKRRRSRTQLIPLAADHHYCFSLFDTRPLVETGSIIFTGILSYTSVTNSIIERDLDSAYQIDNCIPKMLIIIGEILAQQQRHRSVTSKSSALDCVAALAV